MVSSYLADFCALHVLVRFCVTDGLALNEFVWFRLAGSLVCI